MMLGHPTLIYFDQVDRQSLQRYSSATLHFADKPVDTAAAARQCDLAILNGGHFTTGLMLLAGKPSLQIPLTAEQAPTAAAISGMGAGLTAVQGDPAPICRKLGNLLESDWYGQSAKKFSDRYRDFDPQLQIDEIARRVDELAG